MQKPISDSHQPDVAAPPMPPSLWLYGVMFLIALMLIGVAFLLMEKADWPSLLLNISSGIVSAVIVLVVIERRLQQSELFAIKQAPKKARLSIASLFRPSTRVARKYATVYQAALEPLLSRAVQIESYARIEPKILEGCNLLGSAGSGKTTLLQSISAKHLRKFLLSGGNEKLVVLYPLHRWVQEVTLEDALIEYIQSFSMGSEAAIKKFLSIHVSSLLLDGYDEIFMKNDDFYSGVQELNEKYPDLSITVASRPNYPSPLDSAPVIELPSLSDEEIKCVMNRSQ